MSSGFNVIRRHSFDATGIRIKELTQELANQRSETAGSQLETDDVRSQGRMDHSTIKLNDERLKFLTTLDADDATLYYEFPNEPDNNFLKVWFMLDHLGVRVRDMSGFQNNAIVSGHPTLRRIEGLDLGYIQTAAGGGTAAAPVMLFNSGTDVVSQTDGEYIWIPDNETIRFTNYSAAGFSITFRFAALTTGIHTYFDPHNQDPDEPLTAIRRIASKTDDVNNGWNVVINGPQLEFHIIDNGVTYQRRATGFSAGPFYQVVITYNPLAAGGTAADRIKIYTAGVLINNSASTTTLFLPFQTNLRIGARDAVSGFFHGYIHDFRIYFGKVLNQTEVTNINTNELTIDNIDKGKNFIIQYALINP